MHHVIYAVDRERFEAATAFFSEVGFTFTAVELGDVGLQVRVDWTGGVELISPLDTEAGRSSAVAEFLASRGDGVYSVAIRVADMAAAEQVAARYGAVTGFRQHRDGDGFALDESEMTVLGLPMTLLATDLP
ncbi:VOC family protein [Mycolicibacterium lutetiense]|nr:VOC family protein [Mycolicibacterium lutetiense]